MEINGVDQFSQMMPMMGTGRMTPPDPTEISSRIISALDKNSDGIISADELEAAGTIGQKLTKVDADGDGAISQEELVAKITEKMEEMGFPPMMADSQIPDLEELKEKLVEMGSEGHRRGQRPDPEEVSDRIISDLDTNEDGVISAEELEAAGLFSQKIAEADTDGDGSVSREELETYVAENPPPPPPLPPSSGEDEETEEDGQTGYEIISRVLEEVLGLSAEEREQFLAMLDSYPFNTTC